jgi:dihydropyrimidinase
MESSRDLLISGGRLITPSGMVEADLLVSGGKIARLGPSLEAPSARRLDARGLAVLPGLIDPHVHLHLAMKGRHSSDDADSGTAAALFGGVTTILDFTSQRRGQPLHECLQERRAEFSGRAHCDYAFHANVTDFSWFDPRDREALSRGWGELAAQLRKLHEAGGRSLKIFTCYSRQGMAIPMALVEKFLGLARAEGFRVLVHAEDDELVESSLQHLVSRGETGAAFYPRSRPREAEAKAVHEVAEAAEAAETPVYFVHVSTAAGAGAIRAARERNRQPVYFETCPQYLLLDDAVYAGPEGMQYTVAPPLRRSEDRTALFDALVLGAVDTVGTDHCPFQRVQKSSAGPDFTAVPNGLPGLETRLVLLHTAAVVPGRMSLPDLVRVCATRPAEIFGLAPRKGSLVEGADADLVFFDPAEEWTLTARGLHMNTDFSPYEGMRVQGRVRSVFLRGTQVVEEGKLVAEGRGKDLGMEPGIGSS